MRHVLNSKSGDDPPREAAAWAASRGSLHVRPALQDLEAMPSDLATLFVAFAAPAVAGYVALRIHEQRLAHDEREADLRLVRELFAEGAGLMEELAKSCHGLRSALVQHLTGVRHHEDEWHQVVNRAVRYRNRLAILYEPGDPVFDEYERLLALAPQFSDLAKDFRAGAVTDETLDEAAGVVAGATMSWLDAAHKVTRARV